MKFDQIVDKKGYLEKLYVDLLITITSIITSSKTKLQKY